jgi:hypothetical protein
MMKEGAAVLLLWDQQKGKKQQPSCISLQLWPCNVT